MLTALRRLIRQARRPRHRHTWVGRTTLSGWTSYHCTTCGAHEIG